MNSKTLGQVKITLHSCHRNLSIDLDAHILKKVSATLPSSQCAEKYWQHTKKLNLADPQFWLPRDVDILIGADFYPQIMKSNIIRGSISEPIAQLSIFGWLISGPVTRTSTTSNNNLNRYSHQVTSTSETQLQDLLTKFWIQEEVPVSSDHAFTPEEEECEQHFRKTHSRDHTGRYVVRIPLKQAASCLGESFKRAQSCFRRMENRLQSNQQFGQLYNQFMEEYLNLEHMRPIPSSQLNSQPHYYLPHHGILKKDGDTHKLRVVFNGSALTSSGHSLNSISHTGPNLLLNITDVIFWLRLHQWTFSTDISKMYRQIKVHSDDWDLQRILWKNQENQETHFHLTTVTYGTRAAPFLATRSLLQLVEDEGGKFPQASELLKNGRYVDDIFGGADDVQSLNTKAQQLSLLCMAGGMPLDKWHSNSPDFIFHNSNDLQSISLDDCKAKILGLDWNPGLDKLSFHSNLDSLSQPPTKRLILSEISQVFDPLGIVSPVIISAKIILQELWILKISWDELIPESLASKWLRIRSDLSNLTQISIPRWFGIRSDSEIELHGFSDASQYAMGAVIYFVIKSSSSTSVSFVCSKTKVAPIKHMSIPRLELTSSHILAKLTNYVVQQVKFNISKIHLWTDSSVTLYWINSHPSKWKDFVRNRVSAIQELVPTAQWRHVPGKCNPADCASRGMLTSQLISHDLWWNGPEWLLSSEEDWPDQPESLEMDDNAEARPAVALTAISSESGLSCQIQQYCSTLPKLYKLTAIIMLACRKFKSLITTQPSISYVTADLINQAKLFWIRQTQQSFFKEQLKLLRQGSLSKGHVLYRLMAYIDDSDILRVGGRLMNSKLRPDSINPIILPRRSAFTSLVIDHAHLQTLHGGTQLTLSKTRQEFWIIGGRAPVRSRILHCVTCARYRAQRAQQKIGQLPEARVTPSRPFSHVGVDYAGPLLIKSWKGRGSKTYKGWICVFVCFSTSAVHLEAVTDCSTDGFLAAYRRFTSRRGLPFKIYSDCGTNFVGANKTLQQLHSQAQQQSSKLAALLSQEGTTWKFNPPAAPHMGGKWESVVKSIKFHLRRTIGETLYTFEEIITLLTQIEAILNSRPLEPLSNDPDDLAILTPGHFLIGTAINSPPEPSLLNITESKLSRWQLIQAQVQRFWKQWSTHYIQHLQSVSKWHHPSHDIVNGSLVLISSETLPPGKWPMARVIELHPGPDGLTRVVTLKTANASLQRPVHKLVVLPVYDHDQPVG